MPLFALNSLSINSMEGIYPDSWRLFSEKADFVEGVCKVSLSLDWNVWVHDHMCQLFLLECCLKFVLYQRYRKCSKTRQYLVGHKQSLEMNMNRNLISQLQN